MKFSKLFYEAHKIVPFKRLAPVFIVMGIISLYMIIMTICSDNKSNRSFYEALIIGEINDICNKQHTWYKIGQDWFILLNDQIGNLSIGDSIYKNNNSNVIKIYDRTGRIKYEDEVTEIGFKISKTEP